MSEASGAATQTSSENKNPVPLPRRSGKTPRGQEVALPGVAQMAATKFVSGGLPGNKSPRRLAEGERFTFEETKILELFKKLTPAAQNKVLDAMEDWQDEVAEQELIMRAEEEEKRIKAAKLEAIRLEEEQYQKTRRSVDLSSQGRDVVQPALQEMLRQQQVEAEIARLKEEAEKGTGHGSLAPHMSTGEERVEKPLLRKIATLTSEPGAKPPVVAPVPAPRRDSRATPVQKPVAVPGPSVAAPTAASGGPEPEGLKTEVLKTRNPKLANMMAMIGNEESKGGLFADQTMTPDVPRHKVTTVMSQTNAEIEKREHQKDK